MAKKTVVVETTQEQGYKLVSQIGKHTLYIDQPEAVGGTDAGPTPLQYFLLSWAGCISAIARIVANQQRIALHAIKLKVQGELDPDRLMGGDQGERVGFTAITVEADIDGDLSLAEKQAFLREVIDAPAIAHHKATFAAAVVKVHVIVVGVVIQKGHVARTGRVHDHRPSVVGVALAVAVGHLQTDQVPAGRGPWQRI